MTKGHILLLLVQCIYTALFLTLYYTVDFSQKPSVKKIIRFMNAFNITLLVLICTVGFFIF